MSSECKSSERSVASRIASWLILVGGLSIMAGLPLLTTNAEYAWPREAEMLAGHARDYARADFRAGTWDGRQLLSLPPDSDAGRGAFVYPVVVPDSGADQPRARVYVVSTTDDRRSGFLHMDFDLNSDFSRAEIVWIDPKTLLD